MLHKKFCCCCCCVGFCCRRLCCCVGLRCAEHVPKSQQKQQQQQQSATTNVTQSPRCHALRHFLIVHPRETLLAQLVRDYFQIRHSFMRELFLLQHLFLNNSPVAGCIFSFSLAWRRVLSFVLLLLFSTFLFRLVGQFVSAGRKVIFDVFTEFFA